MYAWTPPPRLSTNGVGDSLLMKMRAHGEGGEDVLAVHEAPPLMGHLSRQDERAAHRSVWRGSWQFVKTRKSRPSQLWGDRISSARFWASLVKDGQGAPTARTACGEQLLQHLQEQQLQ
ncbi:unnamed protein product [Lampetra fluviatilis]